MNFKLLNLDKLFVEFFLLYESVAIKIVMYKIGLTSNSEA